MTKKLLTLPPLPLGWVLVIPFILQLILSVGLVGYLSYRSGQNDLSKLADLLRDQTTQRIRDHLNDRLDLQKRVLINSHQAIQRGELDLSDRNQLYQAFWQQINHFPYLSTISFSSEQGEEVGYGRLMSKNVVQQVNKITGIKSYPGMPYQIHRPPQQLQKREYFLVNERGKPTQLAYSQIKDVRQLPWYQFAKKLKNNAWSPIYVSQVVPMLNLSFLVPIYNAQGKFEGTLNNSVGLTEIASFLSQLKFSASGQAFIVDRSGHLIASSTQEVPFRRQENKPPVPLKAAESQNSWLQAIAAELKKEYEDLNLLKADRSLALTIPLENETLFVDVQSYQDPDGLDWFLIVAIPKSDFMAEIELNRQKTLFLCGITLIIATILGILTARWVTLPILRLNQASQALAQGNWTEAVPLQGRIQELDNLAQSFNQMGQKIQDSQSRLRLSLDQLENHNQQLQQFLEAIPLGIRIVDRQGRVRYANQHLLALTGEDMVAISHPHEPSPTFNAYLAGSDQPYPTEQLPIVRALAGEQHRIDDLEIHYQDQIIPLEAWGSPIYNAQGEIEYALVVFQDISDRRLAAEKLEKSRAQFQRLVDDIGDKFVIFSHTGLEGILTYVSGGLYSIFGVEREAVIGQCWGNAIEWIPDDQQLAYEAVKQACDNQSDFQQFELRFIHPNGQLRTINVAQHPARDTNGQVIAIEGIIEDVSEAKQQEAERQKAEQQLQQTNEQLFRASRLKDEFLAMMSHELRTPLNAILGMTEGLQEEIYGPTTEQQKKSLATIEKSGLHLLQLINDILDVSKIEAGQVDLELQPTSLYSLCESTLLFVQQLALKKQIQLQSILPPSLPNFNLDNRRIRQILINLLSNAVKFTPDGGRVTLEVTYPASQSTNQPDPYLRFTIKDTGIGIAAENIPKLFQPFVQIDSSLNRQYEGTGLGLTLVKQIVDLHGGKIQVTSTVSKGSCFIIDLPVQTIPDSTRECTFTPSSEVDSLFFGQNSSDTAEIKTQHKTPLILLAEDNPANVITMQSYLTAKGYELVIADNGEEAIALAQSQNPDIILIDIQMPKMDGLNAIQQIRLQPQLTHTPIIALTALAMDGDRDRCLQVGANEYLSKPVKLRQLATIIERLIKNS